MTDTYTTDAIRVAWDELARHHGRAPKMAELLHRLQRPAWKPAVGEVYPRAYTDHLPRDIYYACHQSHHTVSKTARPQTLAMHGPAVKALRDVVEQIAHDNGTVEMAQEALEAFDEVVI